MRKMFRYTVPIDDQPHEFKLSGDPVAVANGSMVDEVEFWAEFSDDAPGFTRQFRVFGTGQALPDSARYTGTCPRTHMGLVWHLYEVTGIVP